MYTIVKSASKKDIGVRLVPTLLVSLIIAEMFFKFGSFSSECLAFLATWAALDGLVYFVQNLQKEQQQ